MNCTTCHTSGTRIEPIPWPRAICHGRLYMPLWLSSSSASWRKSKFLVSEFPLVTQLDWALNYLFVRLPMLLLRLQKSGKNGISTFLRFPLHREYQRTTTGYSPRCSCLAGNWGYLLTQWQPNFPFKHRGGHIRWRIWTGGPNPPYIGITDWLLFFCQEQCEGTGGGKSGDQPPKDVYDTHCDAGIDISGRLPYQIWVLRPSVSCMRQ